MNLKKPGAALPALTANSPRDRQRRCSGLALRGDLLERHGVLDGRDCTGKVFDKQRRGLVILRQFLTVLVVKNNEKLLPAFPRTGADGGNGILIIIYLFLPAGQGGQLFRAFCYFYPQQCVHRSQSYRSLRFCCNQ